jgi:hypothetical protein
MATIWVYLTLLGLLLLWPPAVGPAAAQVETTGEMQAYGEQTVNYGAGCAEYTVHGYLKTNGTEATPTTREQADVAYTLNGNRATATADMTSVGQVNTKGSGLDGSFNQTHTVVLTLEGAFKNCPGEPFYRSYTGTQTLDGATLPGGGEGELKGFGEQTLSITAACDVVTFRPVNESGSDSQNGTSNGSSTASGRASNGRLTLDAECQSIAQVSRTGAISGTFTQTQTLDFGPPMQTNPGSIPGVSGTTVVTASQSQKVSTGE